MPVFDLYSGAEQNGTEKLKRAAELSLCELEMGIAKPSAAFDTLWEYADSLADERQYDTLLDVAQKMCALAREHGLARQEAVSLIKLGSAHERKCEPREARECYSRSLELCRALILDGESETAQDDLAVACFRLGFIDYLTSGETGLVSEACDIWHRLHGQTENYEYRRRALAAENLLATPVEASAPEQTALPTELQSDAPDSADKKRKLAMIIIAAILTAAVVIELVLLFTSQGLLS